MAQFARGTAAALAAGVKTNLLRLDRLPEVGAAAAYAIGAWAVCAAVLSLALFFSTLTTTALAVHAVAVPPVCVAVAFVYFRRPQALGPFAAAIVFALLAFVLDRTITIALHRTCDAACQALATGIPSYAALVSVWITGLAFEQPERAERHSVT